MWQQNQKPAKRQGPQFRQEPSSGHVLGQQVLPKLYNVGSVPVNERVAGRRVGNPDNKAP